MEEVVAAKEMSKHIVMLIITYQYRELHGALLHARHSQPLKCHGKMAWHLPALQPLNIFGKKNLRIPAHRNCMVQM